MALLAVVFAAQLVATPTECLDATYHALCTATAVVGGDPLGVLVAPLLHGSPTHLLLNAGLIGVFGWFFERRRGSREYLLFLFASASLTQTAQLLGEVVTGAGLPVVVGASGAGYALAGFTAAASVRSGVPLRPLAVGRAGVAVLATLVVLEAATALATPSGTSATLAHAVGAVLGLAWGVTLTRDA